MPGRLHPRDDGTRKVREPVRKAESMACRISDGRRFSATRSCCGSQVRETQPSVILEIALAGAAQELLLSGACRRFRWFLSLFGNFVC